MEGGSARPKTTTYTGYHKQKKKKHAPSEIQTTIQMLEWAKTFHALGRTSQIYFRQI
jgi:hypothetical protein